MGEYKKSELENMTQEEFENFLKKMNSDGTERGKAISSRPEDHRVNSYFAVQPIYSYIEKCSKEPGYEFLNKKILEKSFRDFF